MAEENEDKKSSILSSTKEESPVRAVVCLRRKEDMKRFEETEECFILEFDPFESLDLSRLSLDHNKNNNHIDDGLSIVAEKGPVNTSSILPTKTVVYSFLCCYCFFLVHVCLVTTTVVVGLLLASSHSFRENYRESTLLLKGMFGW